MMPFASLFIASANGLSTETKGGSRSDEKYAILSLIGSAAVAIGNSGNTMIAQRARALVTDFPILFCNPCLDRYQCQIPKGHHGDAAAENCESYLSGC